MTLEVSVVNFCHSCSVQTFPHFKCQIRPRKSIVPKTFTVSPDLRYFIALQFELPVLVSGCAKQQVVCLKKNLPLCPQK